MDGQVLGGGVVVLVAVGLWLVYLLPSWHSRHQYDAAERNAVRLNQALRVLAETSETPDEVRAELTARSALAQQKLARRTQAEREQAELEEARRELALARALPAARRARARRRARVLAAVIGITALAMIASGAWMLVTTGSQLLMWSGVGVALVCVFVLRRMAVVGARAAVEAGVTEDAAPRRSVGELQDVELTPTPSWTPRSLPRPLTASSGSRAAAVLDGAEQLRRAAREEALRAAAAEQAPPSIAAARRAQEEAARAEEAAQVEQQASPFARMGYVDDAEIEAHVRQLLARRAAS